VKTSWRGCVSAWRNWRLGMSDDVLRKIFGLLAFLGIVGLWTLLWYMVGFHNGKMLTRFGSRGGSDD